MRRTKALPVPQKEFGFTQDTFNLNQDWTNDGERLAREHEQGEKMRQLAATAQAPLFSIEN